MKPKPKAVRAWAVFYKVPGDGRTRWVMQDYWNETAAKLYAETFGPSFKARVEEVLITAAAPRGRKR
jgi:hypothetical protein